MSRIPTGSRLAILFTAAFVVLAGCTSEKIVYRDRAPFNPPPDSVSGFLGYFDVSTKQTTCGNCHVEHQQKWIGTKHAQAWADLTNSGHAAASCSNCHSVGPNGNPTTGNVGYAAVQDSAYHDVQCESCHGPGLQHVQAPDQPGNVPLAHVTLTDSTASCASCHSGAHNSFAEDWATSGHSQVVSATVGNAACASCHDGKGTLVAWGVNTHYVEKDSAGSLPVVCSVCHDPHGSPNDAQLRFSITSPDPEQNLCMKCHLRRSEPATGSHGLTPHAPQGAVLLGFAGYRPAGFAYDTSRVFTSHASERNPRLCAGCHVNSYSAQDPLTNTTVMSTGHNFLPIPCLDANNRPSADTGCAYTTTARTWQACTNSGCHADANAAQSAFTNEVSRLNTLADQIWVDANGNGSVDASDGGYLATIMTNTPDAFATDTVLSAAEGAYFNENLVGPGRYANGDGSMGVHNPFLAEALLRANIAELQATYPYLSAPAPAVEQILKSPWPKSELQPMTARLATQLSQR